MLSKNWERVRETTASTSNTGRHTCDLDLNILECPICAEPLSPRVYQCQNGHQLCSECHMKIYRCPSCSEPVGNIRNLLAEKIIASLQVKCKHASNGCRQMLQYSTREEYIKNLCAYRPSLCPVPGCMHEGPKQTLDLHLETKHVVKSALLTSTGSSVLREATFTITEEEDVY